MRTKGIIEMRLQLKSWVSNYSICMDFPIDYITIAYL